MRFLRNKFVTLQYNMTQLRHTEMTCMISLISCQQNLEQQDSWNMYIWNYFKAEYGQIYGHILLNESFIELKRVKWIPSPRSITADFKNKENYSETKPSSSKYTQKNYLHFYTSIFPFTNNRQNHFSELQDKRIYQHSIVSRITPPAGLSVQLQPM